MSKNKEYIKFSSYIDDAYYFTVVNIKMQEIEIHKGQDSLYQGSIDGFKALEKIKARNFDRVYEQILKCSENLIDVLSKT